MTWFELKEKIDNLTDEQQALTACVYNYFSGTEGEFFDITDLTTQENSDKMDPDDPFIVSTHEYPDLYEGERI